MKKLINYDYESIGNGIVFRLPAKWPYEDFVDFMVVDYGGDFSLIVSTGLKAGLVLINLPKECSSDKYRGIDKNWLISNWSKWVYPECYVNDVYVIERYESSPV